MQAEPTTWAVLDGGRGARLAEFSRPFPLDRVGYTEDEYLVGGTGTAFRAGPDGHGIADREAPYATRVLVRRPIDPAAANGTVVVEWLNVSGAGDSAPGWMMTHREITRRGITWVGVSAQHVGVHGGPTFMGMSARGLVRTDPDRYGDLVHPGDDFSYDLYSQAGHWTRQHLGPVDALLAYGVSQSAYRLTTYLNAVDPSAAVYDGFLVHARGAPAAPLVEDPDEMGRRAAGAPTPFRADLRAPVLCLESETDVVLLGYALARQPETDRLRIWEMAGTAHLDVYALAVSPIDDGQRTPEALAEAWAPPLQVFGQRLDRPMNAGPQRYVTAAALRHLDTWARGGEAPPTAPPLELRSRELVVDDLGIGRGGVRTPAVDVPIVVLSGVDGRGRFGGMCGATVPLPTAEYARRYPTRAAYVDRFTAATDASIAAGFLVAEDREELVAVAGAFWDLLAAIR